MSKVGQKYCQTRNIFTGCKLKACQFLIYGLDFRPIAIPFTRYGSLKIITILREMAETSFEAGVSWNGSFLYNMAAQYIYQGGKDNTFIRMGSVVAFRAGHHIY